MGVRFTTMFSGHGHDLLPPAALQRRSVLALATQALDALQDGEVSYSHVLAATSCPDAIAPSLGQHINQYYHPKYARTHTIDIVQGCTGGVSAMILGSQLCEANRSDVLLVSADAAQKATSVSSDVYEVFKNGVFACRLSYSDNDTRLIHQQTRQYKDLYEVVTIGLGHDADAIISSHSEAIVKDSRKYLGLQLNNALAIRLMKEAEYFYQEFAAAAGHPDILILHQVNQHIIQHLEKVFSKYPTRFINMAKETGNCGCATTGIVLDLIKDEIPGKKVMICSFGTGGVITAGLWQF